MNRFMETSDGMSLFVRELRLDASIGVHHHERGATQPILIDIEIRIYPPLANALAATVDYNLVVEAIQAIVRGRHIELVEQLARESAAAILAIKGVRAVEIMIAKPQAIASAKCAGVRLTVSRQGGL